MLMPHPSPGAWELGVWAKSAQVTADGADAQASSSSKCPRLPSGRRAASLTNSSQVSMELLSVRGINIGLLAALTSV